MNKTIYLMLAGLVATACQPNNQFTITGSLSEPFTGTVYLTCIKDRLTKLDSLTVDNAQRFTFTGTTDRPEYYRIITSPHTYDASLIVEPQSKYRLTIDKHDYEVEVVQGGSEQLLMNDYLEQTSTLKDKERVLGKQLSLLNREKEPQRADSLQLAMNKNFQQYEQASLNFINQHPHTFTATQLAGDLLIYIYPDLQAVYEKLDTATYTYNYSFRKFKEKYEEARDQWLQGQSAPEFTTHDLSGREVKLADFRRQYVLLDFWASWCKPCRERAKQLKANYKQLQERGISICALNMDEKRELWEAATYEDGIVWINTGEIKPFKANPIAATYKVKSLPTLFLVNPEGTIVMQNPTIDDLLKLPKITQ